MLNSKQWDDFFDLIDQIVNDGRPYKDKAEDVRREARARGSEVNLDEFVGWLCEED